MRAATPILLGFLTLAGCASAGGEKPAVCDGKHRRPANLYGSVLSPAPSTSTPGAPPEGAPAGPAVSEAAPSREGQADAASSLPSTSSPAGSC